VLGLTLAAGVAAGTNYLEQDPELALLAGAQVGSVAAGMAFVGAWVVSPCSAPCCSGGR
jgi:hypothetical protein